jgi:carbonic anhydrase/acetyltransferase-like protein (isoleucine patch superfamily)
MINKKYKLGESKEFDGRTLFRVVALRDFDTVTYSDVGGWVESEKNLSQDGNAWIKDEAKIFDNAHISGEAKVYDNAQIFGDAHIYDNALVFDNARVYGNALVSGSSVVCDNALVCGMAKIYKNGFVNGYLHVHGDTIVTKTVNIIYTNKYEVTFFDNYIKIGCKMHSINDWEAFTDAQISKMSYSALKWWKVWKPIIFAITNAY